MSRRSVKVEPWLASVRGRLQPSRNAVHLAAKMVLAGTAGWWICTRAGADKPLFAVLVPLVAMDGDPFSAVNVSVSRTLGVFAGVFIGLGFLQLDLNSTALVALLLAVTLLAGLLLRVGGGNLNNQVAITAMFMLYLGAGTKAQHVGLERIWETAIGAGVAVAVAALLWPPDPLGEARRRLARLRGWLGEDLTRVAQLLERPDGVAAEDHLDTVRDRSLQAVRDVLELERGQRALRLNPRRRKDANRFAVVRQELTAAARQYRHLRTLARIVADSEIPEPPLPAGERAQLARAVAALAPPQTTMVFADLDPASLTDPRAIGLAVKLRQMVEDLPHAEQAHA